MRKAGVALGVVALAVATSAGLTSCGDSRPAAAPTSSPSPTPVAAPTQPITLTLAAYGTDQEKQALEQVTHEYSVTHPGVTVQLMWAPDHDSLLTPIQALGPTPDVFLAARRDLPWLEQEHVSKPLGELLDERGIDFGDDYARDAVEAFSGQNELQCMPYSVSPAVIYYNKDLVDFDALLARGLITSPVTPQAWSWDQFTAAARYAARPRRGTLGVAIDPTLQQLAPFILSGGGRLFDSTTAPTTSTLSSEASKQALATALTLLRDPSVAVTPEQLDQRSALQRFENGEVGMIEGFRDLTPELRRVPGLHFDVMPMPTISSSATVGDLTGLCLGGKSRNTGAAADLIAYLAGDPASAAVTSAGYLVPANLDVLTSPTFLQPDRAPQNAAAFSAEIRSIQPILPDTSDPEALRAVIDSHLRQLVASPTLELDSQTNQLDQAVRREFETLSPSATPTG